MFEFADPTRPDPTRLSWAVLVAAAGVLVAAAAVARSAHGTSAVRPS